MEGLTMSIIIILDGFFTDPAWRPFAFSLAKTIGAIPNRPFFNETKNQGAIVAFKGNYDSWALNEDGIKYLCDAVRDGRIGEGFVILAKKRPNEVVSAMEVGEVAKLLKDVRVAMASSATTGGSTTSSRPTNRRT
jgi:hypothetical protein